MHKKITLSFNENEPILPRLEQSIEKGRQLFLERNVKLEDTYIQLDKKEDKIVVTFIDMSQEIDD